MILSVKNSDRFKNLQRVKIKNIFKENKNIDFVYLVYPHKTDKLSVKDFFKDIDNVLDHKIFFSDTFIDTKNKTIDFVLM